MIEIKINYVQSSKFKLQFESKIKSLKVFYQVFLFTLNSKQEQIFKNTLVYNCHTGDGSKTEIDLKVSLKSVSYSLESPY